MLKWERVKAVSYTHLDVYKRQVWYKQLLALHPEWTVVGEYEDAGVTGTSVRKRKGFQQMLDDGIKFHKYDPVSYTHLDVYKRQEYFYG